MSIPEIQAKVAEARANGMCAQCFKNKCSDNPKTGKPYYECDACRTRRNSKARKEARPAAAAGTKSTKQAEMIEGTADTQEYSTTTKKRIHSLEEALTFFEVDLNVWEVERWLCNKWEMGYKNDADQAAAEPLYQVKIWLRRRLATGADEYATLCSTQKARIEKMSKDLATERAISKRLALNHSGYDDLLGDFKKLADQMGDMSIKYSRQETYIPHTVPVVRGGHTEDAVLLWSDTHFGARVRREDTSGFPEFDLTIAGNRWGYIQKKTKQILTLHRAMYPIKKLYIWVGGDIGNGILHDSPNSNDLFPPAQVMFGYNMLKFGIEDLLTLTEPDSLGNQVFEKIVLMFTVGNHMRLDEKMPMAYQGQRTLDWLIYQFLIERFKNNPKVEIHQEISPFIFENIRGHRYMFAHGNQVGYRNSPDAQIKSIGGFMHLVRGLFDSPEWRRKNQLEGATFDRICIGDIHVPVSFPRFKSNASLVGQNELGANWCLEPIPAGQQLFGVADKHQETFSYFVDCTEIQRDPLNKYGSFATEFLERHGR